MIYKERPVVNPSCEGIVDALTSWRLNFDVRSDAARRVALDPNLRRTCVRHSVRVECAFENLRAGRDVSWEGIPALLTYRVSLRGKGSGGCAGALHERGRFTISEISFLRGSGFLGNPITGVKCDLGSWPYTVPYTGLARRLSARP